MSRPSGSGGGRVARRDNLDRWRVLSRLKRSCWINSPRWETSWGERCSVASGCTSNGVFFGIIANDVLYLKVDDKSKRRYLSAGSMPFKPYAGQYRNHAVLRGFRSTCSRARQNWRSGRRRRLAWPSEPRSHEGLSL